MTWRTWFAAAGLLLCSDVAALSGSSAVHADDPWDPHHLDLLPPEIRQYIAGICRSPPKAQHQFATYSAQDRRWRINLEYLQCDGLAGFRQGGQCLDVDFVESGSHYRLVRKSYAECGF